MLETKNAVKWTGPKRVLVAGGNGLVGKAIQKVLKKFFFLYFFILSIFCTFYSIF